MSGVFRFSFGPWNIHEGADPFGPPVRDSIPFSKKLKLYKGLGFDGVQFHDDDAVPGLNEMSAKEIQAAAKKLKKALDSNGLQAEFVAPRLWEDGRTIDGAFTSNNAAERAYALERLKKCVDIAVLLDAGRIVMWLAREGTYIREAKDPAVATRRLVEAVQVALDRAPGLKVLIEPKPNEPMDHAYIPTIGHALALAHLTTAPERVGCLVESAHAILAGLDPSDEMGFALAQKKLWSVHLNDQNGLKFDEDKAFGSANLRRAFNQVRVLDQNDFGRDGEWVGLDVKTMRTQKLEVCTKHLANSRTMFLRLLEISRSLDESKIQSLIAARDYEELDLFILNALTGH